MAKKQRVRIKNSRPRHNFDTDIISNTAQTGSPSGAGVGSLPNDSSGNPQSCTNPAGTGGGT